MSEEISFESLGLTKTLDKMTVKELRQLCIDKIPQITGASGKDKEELLTTIKDLFGISDGEGEKVNPYKGRISACKREIKSLREERVAAETRAQRDMIRKKINKLKKRTRRLARAV